MNVPEESLVAVPDSVSDEAAAQVHSGARTSANNSCQNLLPASVLLLCAIAVSSC